MQPTHSYPELKPFRTRVSLLSADEQMELQEVGLVRAFEPDIIVSRGDGTFIWTVKGLQLYKAACSHFCAAEPFGLVSTLEQLGRWVAAFQLELVEDAQRAAHEILQSGEAPAELRGLLTAICNGQVRRAADATRQTLQYRQTNVTLFPSKN